MRKAMTQRQFLEGLTQVFRVDGSAVTTNDDDNTGLVVGQHLATIKKGSGADSNLVTITLNSPFGQPPTVMFQEETLDLICRLETAATKSVIQVRTLELDGVTQEDDADFVVVLIGHEGVQEGRY